MATTSTLETQVKLLNGPAPWALQQAIEAYIDQVGSSHEFTMQYRVSDKTGHSVLITWRKRVEA